MTNGFNLDSQFSLVFGQAMDEELFNRLFDEMEELLEYISVDSAYAEQLAMMLYETILWLRHPKFHMKWFVNCYIKYLHM